MKNKGLCMKISLLLPRETTQPFYEQFKNTKKIFNCIEDQYIVVFFCIYITFYVRKGNNNAIKFQTPHKNFKYKLLIFLIIK